MGPERLRRKGTVFGPVRNWPLRVARWPDWLSRTPRRISWAGGRSSAARSGPASAAAASRRNRSFTCKEWPIMSRTLAAFRMDRKLLLLINRQWTSPALDWIMAVFSSFDLWAPFFVLGALLLLWRASF